MRRVVDRSGLGEPLTELRRRCAASIDVVSLQSSKEYCGAEPREAPESQVSAGMSTETVLITCTVAELISVPTTVE